jgi:hypothetical protein
LARVADRAEAQRASLDGVSKVRAKVRTGEFPEGRLEISGRLGDSRERITEVFDENTP